MSELLDKLHDAVFTITELVVNEDFKHMKRPWEMILGGLIIPAITKEDKGILEVDPSYKTLMDKYTKDKITKYFHPEAKIIEKSVEVEKIVEKEVIKEVVKKEVVRVPVVTGAGERPVFRRLKEKVEKVKRIERELGVFDRDYIITWWNTNQRLVPDDDPICADLAKELTAQQSALKPVSSMQVAGYLSYLCRMGRTLEDVRVSRFDRAKKRGAISILPRYTADLIKAINENWEKERADEAIRAEQHEELRKRRASGDQTPIVASVSKGTPVESPVKEPIKETVEAPEDFDIKFA